MEKADLKNYDPTKLKIVDISDVEPNGYNPKKEDTKEYQDVLESIKRNGLIQPIIVREQDDRLIIVDGEQRYTAAWELGYQQIYVYNLGKISEDEAKALTLWMEVQVPFDRMQLKPIVLELSKKGISLPKTQIKLSEPREIRPRQDIQSDTGEIHSTVVNWKPIVRGLISAHFAKNEEAFRAKTDELIAALEKEGGNNDLVLFLKSQTIYES